MSLIATGVNAVQPKAGKNRGFKHNLAKNSKKSKHFELQMTLKYIDMQDEAAVSDSGLQGIQNDIASLNSRMSKLTELNSTLHGWLEESHQRDEAQRRHTVAKRSTM